MITAVVTNYIKFTGDQDSELVYGSAALPNSPSVNQLATLTVGINDIEVPAIEGLVVHGVAIVPPAANTIEPILMGGVDDDGISLSPTFATVIHFGATPPESIFIEVDDELIGLRLVWF